MSGFSKAFEKSSEYSAIINSFNKGYLPQGILGLIPVQKAHIITSLTKSLKKRALIIVPDESTAVKFCDDLRPFGVCVLHYPARSLSFYAQDTQSHEYEQKRIKVLRKMLDEDYEIVVASIEAVASYTIPPYDLLDKSLLIKKGEDVSLETILSTLESAGYTRVDAVEGVGQYSTRGGIVDFFSPDDEMPIRLELWGDTIDTMCHFDTITQRRTVNIDEFLIAPSKEIIIDPLSLAEKLQKLASSQRGKKAESIKKNLQEDIERLSNGLSVHCPDRYLPLVYSPATIFDYLNTDLVFVSETSSVKEKLETHTRLLAEDIKASFEEGILCKGLDKFTLTSAELFSIYEKYPVAFVDNFPRGSFDVPIKNLTTFTGATLPVWNGKIEFLKEDIAPILNKQSRIVVFAGTDKSAKVLAETLSDDNIPSIYFSEIPTVFPKGTVTVIAGSLSSGFSYPAEKFYVFTYSKIHATSTTRRITKNYKARDTIHSLDELKQGDYVVHSVHGIGIFDGITQLKNGKIVKDYIKIKYAKSDVLYVPVTQLDLVSKYIGPHEDDGKKIKLNRLGTGDWERTKSKVRSAVVDMADGLIKLYSTRIKAQGYAFSPDIDMQNDFERRFEFEETGDQLRSIHEIKKDMEKPYPMDRLLCGDVGFGKTEVALRAVFKCIADGKQCAILVPTTILALQHYQTILKRFDGFPIEVEMLSRFRTPTQRAKIIKSVNSGFIDIIVGTHSLISKNVKFKNLGLLVVDEEQRFGVAQKEKIKEKFPNVDVLTLSATPIPRTLNMAMSGIRDMSVIEEAPSDRFPVQTYVVEHNLPLLCEAMEKELRRGGQVYYLHNNTSDIEEVANRISEFLPDARISVAHGKMDEETLSDIWRELMEGNIDILVCTTIIETGVDVPNCNTLIIENADRLGLSQLHQIRGRVGRSTRRAYAYFTYNKEKSLTEVAYKRLQAIREYTEFGSGFKIAMRDLEIRGAGNLLGSQQHGHLASVGYDMYMKLLSEAIQGEKGEDVAPQKDCLIDLQINAHIPDTYITALSQRLTIYRRIADVRTEEDANDVRDELRDRFGKIPESVNGLIQVSLCRNRASEIGIYEIGQKGSTLALYCDEIDPLLVLELSSILRKRISVTASGKQSINVAMLENQSPLDTLKEIFEASRHYKKADKKSKEDNNES